MKKRQFFIYFLIAFFGVILSCNFTVINSPVFAVEVVEDGINEIDSAATFMSSLSTEEINTNEYVLTNDIEINVNTPLVNFQGVLDGKGHTITIQPNGSVYTYIFQNLTNATIKNLKIVTIYEEVEEIGEEPVVPENPEEPVEQTCTLTSFLTNIATNCSFDNLYLDINIPDKVVVNSSSYLGLLCEKAESGTKITNCYFMGNLAVEQTNPSASETYLGGICGYFSGDLISNCIVDMSLSLSHKEEENQTKLLCGGMVGYVLGKNCRIVNNIFDGEFKNTNTALSGWFIGGVVENLAQVPDASFGGLISKLVQTTTNTAIANNIEPIGSGRTFYVMPTTTYKLNADRNFYTEKSAFTDISFWNPSFEWNFNKYWRTSPESVIAINLLTLQQFSDFEIVVNNDISSYSLTNNLPNSEVLTLYIDGETTVTNKSVSYDNSIVINAKFNNVDDANSYSFFFEIDAIRLNGEKLNIEYEENEGVYSWTIPSVNMSYSGEYTIDLIGRNYKLKVSSADSTRGKVRNSLASVTSDTFDLEIAYGGTYNIISSAEKYFASNGWFVGETTVEGSQQTSSMLNFAFNDTDEFTLSHLLSKTPDEETHYLCEIFGGFTDNFANIEIIFQLNGETLEDTSMFVIKADDERLTLNSEDKYIVKQALGRMVSFNITGTPHPKAVFLGVYNGENDENPEQNKIFSVTPSDATNTNLVYYVRFSLEEENNNNALLWWLIGGGSVLLIAGVVITIIVVKKKKNNAVYKSMWN